jgi:hypothetical protein
VTSDLHVVALRFAPMLVVEAVHPITSRYTVGGRVAATLESALPSFPRPAPGHRAADAALRARPSLDRLEIGRGVDHPRVGSQAADLDSRRVAQTRIILHHEWVDAVRLRLGDEGEQFRDRAPAQVRLT